MSGIKTFEGTMIGAEGQFVIVAARFNGFITESLVNGALDTLRRHGVDAGRVHMVRVPGAFEMGPVVRRLCLSGKYAGVIALGAVIRGATPHFDFVAGECARACAAAAMETGVPVAFGVLTTDTIEQAIERAGTKAGNKGAEAAATALEMVNLMRSLP
ncbi:MAG TPA: 6,7-dimethyl-8-ribityllumazine synthase [Gammaproteobacteria bacterium]